MALYRCKHCKQVVERYSRKRWIKSFCAKTGKFTRLTRLRKLVEKWRNEAAVNRRSLMRERGAKP